MKRYKYTGLFCGLLIIWTILVFGCTIFTPRPYKETQFLMDTVIEITAYGPNAEVAVKEAFAEFKHIQDIADKFNPNSQVYTVNQMAGKEKVVVDRALINMVKQAVVTSELAGGKFDITIGALTDLWGIGRKGDFVPAQSEIDRVLPLVDYRLVQIDDVKNTIFLPKAGMQLDLGGIAKGYAIDKAAAVLEAKGIKSALINDGGDIRVIGNKPDGKPWRIGVQDPRNSEGMIAKVSLDGWDSLDTSGDYQRFFIKDNVRYAHILDPHTGRQPRELISVTLVSKHPNAEKIRSSAIFILGLDRGLALLKQLTGVEAILVFADGHIVTTPGLDGKIELTSTNSPR